MLPEAPAPITRSLQKTRKKKEEGEKSALLLSISYY